MPASNQDCRAVFSASLRLLIISYSCKVGITLLFAGDKAGHIFAYRSGGARCSTEIKWTINQGKQTDGQNKRSTKRTEWLRWKRKHRYQGPAHTEAHAVRTLVCMRHLKTTAPDCFPSDC